MTKFLYTNDERRGRALSVFSGRERSLKLRLALVFVSTFALCGCAAQQMAFRFAPKDVVRVNYDPARCAQQPDGRVRCKDVFFTLATVEVPK